MPSHILQQCNIQDILYNHNVLSTSRQQTNKNKEFVVVQVNRQRL